MKIYMPSLREITALMTFLFCLFPALVSWPSQTHSWSVLTTLHSWASSQVCIVEIKTKRHLSRFSLRKNDLFFVVLSGNLWKWKKNWRLVLISTIIKAVSDNEQTMNIYGGWDGKQRSHRIEMKNETIEKQLKASSFEFKCWVYRKKSRFSFL